MQKLTRFIHYHFLTIIVSASVLISIVSFLYFYTNNLNYLGISDSIPRLNLARKLIDNLTPGFGQLGAVWLPLPAILALPLIWNDYLWHSGIAGSVVSMVFFVMGAVYLYKLLFLIYQDRFASVLGLLLFLTNINILFFQSSPMSEQIFITCIFAILYYLISWSLTLKLYTLLKAGVFLILITLTRYEGYVILLISIGVVLFLSYRVEKQKNRKHFFEATTILFIVMSTYGVIVWSLYLWLIFKDPFIWLKIYKYGSESITSTTGLTKNVFHALAEFKRPNPFTHFPGYYLGVLLANGLITTLIATVGMAWCAIHALITRRFKSTFTIPLVLCIGIAAFMSLANYVPQFYTSTLSLSILTKPTINYVADINLRFGLAMTAFLSIFYVYVFCKHNALKIVGLTVLYLQLLISVFTNMSLYTNLAREYPYKPDQNAAAFKRMYDIGLILISDHTSDYFLFATGINYRNFIHEGTRNYWRESLINPTRYATWIIFNQNNDTDTVRNYLQHINTLDRFYTLRYQHNGFKIYKIKDTWVTLLHKPG